MNFKVTVGFAAVLQCNKTYDAQLHFGKDGFFSL
jgi:hypothetical protein